MSTTDFLILSTIAAYLIMMIGIGIVCSKKTSSVGDFYLGGRKLGPIVTAMSAEASDMSSYLIMGLPGLAYFKGAAEVSWTIIGLCIGTYINWLIVAKRLRVYSQSCKAITIPDFFSNRYRDKKHIIMGISALIILVFFVPYTASGFSACGKLFNSLFGLDYHVAMIISAIVIISYTSIGGFLAASTTDLVQSIVMTLSLIVLIIFGIRTAGGIDHVIENAKSLSGYLHLSQNHIQSSDGLGGTSEPFGFLAIVSTLAWGLGYFGMPHILLRFMAIEDKKKVKVSRRIASVWVVISMAVAMLIGFIGRTLSADGKISILLGNSEAETVVVKMANLMSEKNIIFTLLAGLIFAGILACTMSTADSQLLAASSSMSENILGGVFKIKLTQKQSMLSARGVLLGIALLSVVLAWNPDASIFGIVSFAWAGFGATFGPLMLTALFWKRSNKYGAVAGLITGGVMVFVWKFGISKLSKVLEIYELLPAFILALIVIIVVSLCTSAPEKEITDEFEKVQAEMNA